MIDASDSGEGPSMTDRANRVFTIVTALLVFLALGLAVADEFQWIAEETYGVHRPAAD